MMCENLQSMGLYHNIFLCLICSCENLQYAHVFNMLMGLRSMELDDV